MLTLTAEEISRRRPVWVAVSDLWLDTELQPRDLEHIARVMHSSGYSTEELHDIYALELAPVLHFNLLSPAGEWIVFDADWLCERILHNMTHTGPVRGLVRKVTSPIMCSGTEQHWAKLRDLVLQQRAAQAAL